MLLSMTGYGRGSRDVGSKVIMVEIKTLNSKFLDLKIRVPQGYKDKEMELRKILGNEIMRGKADVALEVKYSDVAAEMVFNKDLFKAYYKELKDVSDELGVSDPADFTQAIMRLPNIVSAGDEVIDENEWKSICDAIDEAIAALVSFRKAEGDVLDTEFRERVKKIASLLEEVDPHESPRIEKIKERFRQSLEDHKLKSSIDENRFEQEVIYYLEKMDVTEEKVRLKQHCDYFIEQLDDTKSKSKGRKLNFISQEMGREINTLGAKANSVDIQKIVVMMKDELEKIKEQTANVL